MARFDQLPPEILCQIMAQISVQDRMTLPLVSRSLNAALSVPKVPAMWGALTIHVGFAISLRQILRDIAVFMVPGAFGLLKKQNPNISNTDFHLCRWISERAAGITDLTMVLDMAKEDDDDEYASYMTNIYLAQVVPAMAAQWRGSGMNLHLHLEGAHPFNRLSGNSFWGLQSQIAPLAVQLDSFCIDGSRDHIPDTVWRALSQLHAQHPFGNFRISVMTPFGVTSICQRLRAL